MLRGLGFARSASPEFDDRRLSSVLDRRRMNAWRASGSCDYTSFERLGLGGDEHRGRQTGQEYGGGRADNLLANLSRFHGGSG